MREALEKMLAAGREDALLRFSLGSACLKDGDAAVAVSHLSRAVELDPAYSAAWKWLGKASEAAGDREGAAAAWRQGIEAARARGDVQAGREMAVFLKRIRRSEGPGGSE